MRKHIYKLKKKGVDVMKRKRTHMTTKNNHNGKRKIIHLNNLPLINYPENIRDCQIKTEYFIPNETWLKTKNHFLKDFDRYDESFYEYDKDCKILVDGCSWGFYKRGVLLFCMEEVDIRRDFKILEIPYNERGIREIKEQGWDPELLSFLICLSILRYEKLIKDLVKRCG